MYIEEFWVSAMKLGTKENLHNFQPLKLANPLADLKANKKQVFQVRWLPKDNFVGSYGGRVRLLIIKNRLHSNA